MAAKKKPAPKRGASRYQAPAKKSIPGWVWLAAGLTIGAFVVFLFKLEPGRGNIKREKAEQVAAAKRDEAAAKLLPPSPQMPAKSKYDFYTLLPESEIIVPNDAVPLKNTPAVTPVTPAEAAKIDTARAQSALGGQVPPPAPPVQTQQATQQALNKVPMQTTTQFFLQAGSFRKQEDADRVRAQIIILGQAARVESGKVKDDTWFRVMVGPFSNREQLTLAQKQLAGSGFANLLLQQRQGPNQAH